MKFRICWEYGCACAYGCIKYNFIVTKIVHIITNTYLQTPNILSVLSRSLALFCFFFTLPKTEKQNVYFCICSMKLNSSLGNMKCKNENALVVFLSVNTWTFVYFRLCRKVFHEISVAKCKHLFWVLINSEDYSFMLSSQ